MPIPGVLVGRLLGAGIMEVSEANAARIGLGLDVIEEGLGDLTPGPKAPIFIPVNSTAIRGVGYIPQNVIVVEFVRGGTYSYDGSFELFNAFVTAPSKGEFFNSHFRR